MTDADALIASILACPEDDLPRLVFADWLDENAGSVPCGWCSGSGKDKVKDVVSDGVRYTYVGPVGPCPMCKGDCSLSDGYRERAEFIRVGCELAKLEHVTKPVISGPILADEFDIATEVFREWEVKKQLKKRERELWNANSGIWFGNRGPNSLPGDLRWAEDDDGLYIRTHGGRGKYVIRRGFCEEVRLPLAEFMGAGECPTCGGDGEIHSHNPICYTCHGTGRTEGIAKRLFQSQPVLSVTLSDREPGQYANTGEWYWARWTPDVTYPLHTLPPEVFDQMAGEPHTNQLGTVVKHYPTRELATPSDALVAYGRSLANLPTLDPVA